MPVRIFPSFRTSVSTFLCSIFSVQHFSDWSGHGPSLVHENGHLAFSVCLGGRSYHDWARDPARADCDVCSSTLLSDLSASLSYMIAMIILTTTHRCALTVNCDGHD